MRLPLLLDNLRGHALLAFDRGRSLLARRPARVPYAEATFKVYGLPVLIRAWDAGRVDRPRGSYRIGPGFFQLDTEAIPRPIGRPADGLALDLVSMALEVYRPARVGWLAALAESDALEGAAYDRFVEGPALGEAARRFEAAESYLMASVSSQGKTLWTYRAVVAGGCLVVCPHRASDAGPIDSDDLDGRGVVVIPLAEVAGIAG